MSLNLFSGIHPRPVRQVLPAAQYDKWPARDWLCRQDIHFASTIQ